MLKRLACLICAGVVWVSGCAGVSAPWADSENAADSDLRTISRPPAPDSDLIYSLLVAELAGQREQFEIALTNYLQVARQVNDARIAERATQIALYVKNPEKALEAAMLWIDRAPASGGARRVAAMLLLKAGKLDAALGQLRALLNLKDADRESALIDLVKWLSTEAPKEDGQKVMRQLVEQLPKDADLRLAYALLATDKGDYQLALEQVQRALALHPDWSRARLLQAQVMSQMGDSAAARGAVRQALKSEPGNGRLRMLYAQFLAKSGDFKAAERELRRVVQATPDNADARFALASVLVETEQFDSAQQEFRRLAELDKWRAQAYFSLGLIEVRKGRMGAALSWFDRVGSGPLEFDSKVNAITALISLGRFDEARKRLGQARKDYPNEALRLYLLEAELLSKNKDYEGAFELLSGAMEELPGQAELYYARALVAEQLERIDVLEADLQAVLAKKPDDANALNALGYSLAERGERLPDAKKFLDRAIELKPDDPAILDSYGWLQYRLGNLDTAVVYLRKAYERVRDPEIASHLGEVLWESGQRVEAKKVWNEALKKDPEHEDMKEIKDRYKEAF